MTFTRATLLIAGLCLALSGCGGGKKKSEETDESSSAPPSSPPASPPASTPIEGYAVSGTVSGLAAGTLKVKLGDETIPLAAGATSFRFSTLFDASASYEVTIAEQGALPSMNCAVERGRGVVTGPVNDVVVKCPALQSIALSSSSTVLQPGTSFTLKAVGLYDDGVPRDLGALGLWSSDDTSVVSLNGRLGSAGTAGTTNVRYGFGLTATLPVTVKNGSLVSLALTPGNLSLPVGIRQAFRLSGVYSDGSVQDLTDSATWTSSDAAVAAVGLGGKKGVVGAYAAGSAIITAQVGSQSSARTVTVNSATLQSLDLAPAFVTDGAGSSFALKATALFSNGAAWDVSESAAWVSSAATTASVSTAGRLDLLTPGSATVTASISGLSDSLPVQVLSKTLNSLAIADAGDALPASAQRRLRLTATYSDFSTADVTELASWVSSSPEIASFEGDSVVRARAAGTARLTAAFAGKSTTADLAVTADTPVSLRLSPGETLLPKGVNLAFRLYGVYAGGIEHELTNAATWSSSNAAIAEIDPATGRLTNKVTGTSPVSVTVQAAFGAQSVSAAVLVTPSTVTSLAITPSEIQVPAFKRVPLRAFGQFDDGGSADLTDVVSWSTSAKSVASVSNADGGRGLVSSLSEGSSNIGAALGSVSATRAVTVSNSGPESVVEAGMGLKGEYYATKSFGSYKGSRIDGTVDFNWATGTAPLGVGDNFSVRWTGFVKSAVGGVHQFCTRSDDGVRVAIDGVVAINNWTDHSETENCANVTLTAGRKTPILIEFYENGGYAVMRLFWTPPGGAKTIVPRSALFDR